MIVEVARSSCPSERSVNRELVLRRQDMPDRGGRPTVVIAGRVLYALRPMLGDGRARRRLPATIGACALGLLGVLDAQQDPARQDPVVPPTAAAPERELKLTLEDALRLALGNNLDLQIQQLVTEEREFAALGSWGAFDPLLGVRGTVRDQEFQGTGSLAGGDVVEENAYVVNSTLAFPLTTGGSFDLSWDHVNEETTNEFAAFDVSTTDVLTVALTQPLLRGAWRRYATAQQKESEIQLDIQREREREIRNRMLLDVTNAYWDLASAREQLGVRELAVELGNQQLAQDRRRLEVGAGTEVDVLQSETNVAQQEQLRLQAEFGVRQSADDLRRLIFKRPKDGMEQFLEAWDWPVEPLTPLPDVSTESLDWQLSLERAIQNRPELWQRRFDIDIAEVRLSTSRSERLPQLDLALASSGIGFDADPQEAFDTALGWDFPGSSASLIFSIPILNRTARYAERSARTVVRAARLTYDRTELDVLAEVRASVRAVLFSGESVDAAIKSRDLARRQLEAEETRQSVGLSTTFQVLEFQEDLAVALSTEVSARAAHAKSLAALEHAEGRLGEGLGQAPAPTVPEEPGR